MLKIEIIIVDMWEEEKKVLYLYAKCIFLRKCIFLDKKAKEKIGFAEKSFSLKISTWERTLSICWRYEKKICGMKLLKVLLKVQI
jgi:hypothetical protein